MCPFKNAGASPLRQHTADGGLRIVYREYIGDLIAHASAFDNVKQLALNPGLPATFSWLAGIAHNFTEYKWNHLAIQYLSRTSSGLGTSMSVGTIMLCTSPDPYTADYNSKMQILQTANSVSGPPQADITHIVDTQTTMLRDTLLVRTGPLSGAGQDLRNYDIGKTQICTQTLPASANYGELWALYDVTFYKPKLDMGTSPSTEGPGLVTAFIANYDQRNTLTGGSTTVGKQLGLIDGSTQINRTGQNYQTGKQILVLPPQGNDLPPGVTPAPQFVIMIWNGSKPVFHFTELAVGKWFKWEYYIATTTTTLRTNFTASRDAIFRASGWTTGNDELGPGIRLTIDDQAAWGIHPATSSLAAAGGTAHSSHVINTIPRATCAGLTVCDFVNEGYFFVEYSNFSDSDIGGSKAWMAFNQGTTTANDLNFANIPQALRIVFREVPGPGLHADDTAPTTHLTTAMF